jgi:hypothetical protein
VLSGALDPGDEIIGERITREVEHCVAVSIASEQHPRSFSISVPARKGVVAHHAS